MFMLRVLGRMLLVVTENPIRAGLSNGKYIVSHNWKAGEAGFLGGASVPCHPQQHWLHSRLGCLSGRGLEEGKRETHRRSTYLSCEPGIQIFPLSQIQPTQSYVHPWTSKGNQGECRSLIVLNRSRSASETKDGVDKTSTLPGSRKGDATSGIHTRQPSHFVSPS